MPILFKMKDLELLTNEVRPTKLNFQKYTHILQLNNSNKHSNNSNEKWAEAPNRHFQKKTYRWAMNT